MKLNFTKLSTAAMICFALASCKKNDAVNSASSQQSSLARATNTIGALADESDLDMKGVVLDKTTDCGTTTYNPSADVYPHTKIVDYGSGCTEDGVTRSGRRVYTEYADKKTAPAGKVVSILIYDNYVVNGIAIAGSVKTSVVKSGANGPLVLRLIASKTITDNSNGNTSSYINSELQTQTEGVGTDDGSDDVYEIKDNAYGTQITDGIMYTYTYITDPTNKVIKPNNCNNRTQGALKISLKNNGVTTNEVLDYGNGDCDKTATVTVENGTPETVTLPFYFFVVN